MDLEQLFCVLPDLYQVSYVQKSLVYLWKREEDAFHYAGDWGITKFLANKYVWNSREQYTHMQINPKIVVNYDY